MSTPSSRNTFCSVDLHPLCRPSIQTLQQIEDAVFRFAQALDVFSSGAHSAEEELL